MLLDAISAASYLRSGDNALVTDRAGLREYLDNLSGFHGVTGVLGYDEFGDCGASRVVIHEHLDSTDIQATRENIVFEVGPEGQQTGVVNRALKPTAHGPVSPNCLGVPCLPGDSRMPYGTH